MTALAVPTFHLQTRVRLSPQRLPQSIPVVGLSRSVAVKIASCETEWEQAFTLAANSYQSRGYESPGASRMRFTPYHALPDTVTLVACEDERVIATLSIVPDNTLLGLPMERIYGNEIMALRRAGRRLFEVTTLADCNLGVREFVTVFVALIRLATQYHTHTGGDTGVIAVNPRHRSFYTRILGFMELGPRRTYAAVQDHPAEALWIDEESMWKNTPDMHAAIFGERLPHETLLAPRIPRKLVQQYSLQSCLCDVKSIGDILTWAELEGSLRRW
jgi:hypothetical protein